MKKELIKNMVSLIVGEALLEFIENPTSPNIVNDLREKYSEKILSAIDSLQEESVSEDDENALNSVAITFLQEQQIVPNFYADIIMKAVKRGANWQREQDKIVEKLMDRNYAKGFDACKRQLMAKAVIGEICEDNCGSLYVHAPIPCSSDFSRLDIVKVLIIKED